MSTYQVAWDQITRTAVVQNDGATAPAGYVIAGKFEDDNGPYTPDIAFVLYHHIRDVLYKVGVMNMQALRILDGPLLPVPLSINLPGTVPGGVVGTAFTMQLSRVGGVAPYVWSLTTKPANMVISATGKIDWPVPVLGTHAIVAKVVDGAAAEATKSFNVVVTAAPVETDSRPIYFNAPANANTVGTQGFLDGGTKFGTSGSKVGQVTVTTTANNYAWVAVLASASTAGVTFTDPANFQGGWSGAGMAGDQEEPQASTDTSSVLFTAANGVTYRLFRQDWKNANATAMLWKLS